MRLASATFWALNLASELFKLGVLDFAGGTVVHISAGVSALVMRRVYVSHWGTAKSGRTRILIFGAGSAGCGIADQPVRPEVRDVDLELVALLLRRASDLEGPRRAPRRAEVLPVEPIGHSGQINANGSGIDGGNEVNGIGVAIKLEVVVDHRL